MTRVILLEDNEADAELTMICLREVPDLDVCHVQGFLEFKKVFGEGEYDAVLSDYNLVNVKGGEVLDYVRSLKPELPFIIISGMLGEERAVNMLKQGATDYVLKDNLAKLPLTLSRALKESEQRFTERLTNRKLLDSAEKVRIINVNSPDLINTVNRDRIITYSNRYLEEFDESKVIGTDIVNFVLPEFHNKYKKCFSNALKGFPQELVIKGYGDNFRPTWYQVRMAPETIDGKINSILIISTDISARKDAEIRDEVINNISAELNKDISISQFLGLIRSELGKVFPTESFYVCTYNKLGKELTFIYQYLENEPDPTIPYRMATGNGLSEFVINDKNALLLNWDGIVEFQNSNGIHTHISSIRSWMGVPIIFEKEVFGVIAAMSFTDDNCFCDKDMDFLTFTGSQVGAFLARRKAEDKLKDSQVKWDSLVKNTGDIIITTSKDGKINYINRIVNRLGEKHRILEDFIGLEFESLVSQSDMKMVSQRIKAAISNEETVSFIMQGSNPNHYYDCTSTPLIHENMFQGMIIIMKDITELIQAQNIIKKSEEKYRSVVQDQTEYIVRWKLGGEIIFANKSYINFTGLSEQELYVQNYFSLVPEEEGKRFSEKIKSLSPKEPVKTDLHQGYNHHGELFWHEWIDRAIFDQTGTMLEYQSVGRDITVQKMAELEIRDLERISNAVIQGGSLREISTIIMENLSNIKGILSSNIYLLNSGTGQFYVLGESLDDSLTTKLAMKPNLKLNLINHNVMEGSMLMEFLEQEKMIISSDKNEIGRLLIAYPEKTDDKNLNNWIRDTLMVRTLGAFLIVADDQVLGFISFTSTEELVEIEKRTIIRYLQHAVASLAKKQTEDELRNYKINLEKLVDERTIKLNDVNAELEAFNYSVSHDLRSPIRAIDIYQGLLAEELKESSLLNYVKQIENCTLEMNELIKSMLEFSKMSRAPIILEATDLNVIVKECFEKQKKHENSPNAKLRMGKLPILPADQKLLNIAINNLISNAIKYSAKQEVPLIEVGHTESEKDFVIFIRDNGVGFDNKLADKLFKPFSRLHHGEEFKGTGAGLAIVERIIRRHNGRIYAESNLNKGAVFYFTLPNNLDQPLTEQN